MTIKSAAIGGQQTYSMICSSPTSCSGVKSEMSSESFVSAFARTGFQRTIKSLGGVAQRLTVGNISWGNRSRRLRQIAQDLGEQHVVEVHADGFARVCIALPVQAERNSGFIKVGVEARALLECSDIELVWIFYRYFGLVGNWFGHGTAPY